MGDSHLRGKRYRLHHSFFQDLILLKLLVALPNNCIVPQLIDGFAAIGAQSFPSECSWLVFARERRLGWTNIVYVFACVGNKTNLDTSLATLSLLRFIVDPLII